MDYESVVSTDCQMVRVTADLKPVLVDLRVALRTDNDQVLERVLSTAGPEHDVVMVRLAREHAADAAHVAVPCRHLRADVDVMPQLALSLLPAPTRLKSVAIDHGHHHSMAQIFATTISATAAANSAACVLSSS